MFYIVKWVCLGLVLLLFTACSAGPVNVYIRADRRLNPDTQNRPLPVLIKLYQLQDKNAFYEATFRELWHQDRTTLGDTMLDSRVLSISPGQSVKTVLRRKKGCRYLGAIAIFRQPYGDSWRALKSIHQSVPLLATTVHIDLLANKIFIR